MISTDFQVTTQFLKIEKIVILILEFSLVIHIWRPSKWYNVCHKSSSDTQG